MQQGVQGRAAGVRRQQPIDEAEQPHRRLDGIGRPRIRVGDGPVG